MYTVNSVFFILGPPHPPQSVAITPVNPTTVNFSRVRFSASMEVEQPPTTLYSISPISVEYQSLNNRLFS